MTETARPLRLGSLFDGSGGFPLAGSHCGIQPVWASEIEPFPILVTTTRFPDMEHLGDVAQIKGGEVEPVDIVTFGSPCQDLSIAGRRGGLDGERSGLFFHAARIIREMREASNGQYPRFAVWENVPGAFSSNHGADFHAVLQTLAAIIDPDAAADLPRVDKWEPAGAIVGEGWSIAWRVLDAQFFGVPQRRKRIFLVADFASERAGHILFESDSLPRDTAPSRQTRQDPPTTTPASAGSPSRLLSPVFAVRERGGKPGGGKGPLVQDDLSGTLGCGNDQVIIQPLLFDHHPQDSRVSGPREVASTVTARYGTGGGNTPIVVNAYGFNAIHLDRPEPSGRYGYETEVAKTLDTSGISPTCNQGGIAVMETYSATQGSFTQILENVSPTLCARDYKAPPAVTTRSVVRKLTPTECARLQGFPDSWTHNLQVTNPSKEQLEWWWRVFATWAVARGLKKTKTRTQVAAWLANPVSDTALYKMWGNGIALPCAQLVLSRIAAEVTGNR